jgi:hypothetical protein
MYQLAAHAELVQTLDAGTEPESYTSGGEEMSNKQSVVIAMSIFGCVTVASANVPIYDEISIITPCDNAQVEVFWMGSDAGYTGELSWINPLESGNDIALWTNHSAIEGQSFILPGLFTLGQRVDFSYEIIQGQQDFFSTANESDWGQFIVDDSNPVDVWVGIEDIRLPGGDSDHNDASFRVVFSHPAVPAPGAMALLGAGGLMFTRRRR